MQSAFEKNAQRAAVKAVEDRLAHNDRVRREASRRRSLSSLGGILVGLAILVAIGYWFSLHSEGVGSIVGSAVDTVRGLFAGDAPAEVRSHDAGPDGTAREKLSVKVSRTDGPRAGGKGKNERKTTKKRGKPSGI